MTNGLIISRQIPATFLLYVQKWLSVKPQNGKPLVGRLEVAIQRRRLGRLGGEIDVQRGRITWEPEP